MTVYKCPILFCNQEIFSTSKNPVVFHLKWSHTEEELLQTAILYGVKNPLEKPKFSVIHQLINKSKLTNEAYRN